MKNDDLTTDDREIRDLMQAYGKVTAPKPDDGFYNRAIARAVHEGRRSDRRRWVMTGFSAAAAALAAVWIVSGVFFAADGLDSPTAPTVTMALEQPQTLNLVFASAKALDDATMTVQLPAGVEIDGFPGQREITWMTSLSEGRNILPLTLIATTPVGGEILATLQHEDDDKLFRLQVTVI